MLITGDDDSADELQILAALWKAKNDSECVDLELRSIEFDHEFTSLLIDVIKSKTWKSISLAFCRGLVTDVVTACMSYDIVSFHVQTLENANRIHIMHALSFGLNYSKSLQSLSMSIQMDPHLSTDFTKSIARNVTLEELDLSRSTIPNSMIGNLGFAFRINRTLKKISLDKMYLEDSQLASLLYALQDHPSLKSISIQYNGCHDQGMSAISALLHYNELEELNMSYLVRKKKTEILTMEEEEQEEPVNRITNESLTNVLEQEEDASNNEAIGTDENIMSKEDDSSEVENSEVEEHEEEEEEEESANGIKNESLKVLHLAGNGISDSFIESMLNILGEKSALEELNLFGNQITDRGILSIIKKLPELTKIRLLYLGQNRFSLMASYGLLEAMRTNYLLEGLHVRSFNDDPKSKIIQEQIDYYALLNKGGRRIFASDLSKVPRSLWPLILERANSMYPATSPDYTSVNASHAADVIFCLLHGPILHP